MGQAYEREVPVEAQEWIGLAPAPPDPVFGTQPQAQPHSGVTVERPVRFANRTIVPLGVASCSPMYHH
jgi:hypothetical protein